MSPDVQNELYLGELATALFYLFVGARLMRPAAGAGEAPERLLGWLFLVSGISYLLYWVPVSEAKAPSMVLAARTVYLPAPVLLAIFTRRVFRPREPWAAWLVYATAFLMVASLGTSLLYGDWEGFSLASPWFWSEWLGYTLPFGWAGIETLHQYAQARRRLALGLCTPVVCNRFLLWGLFGVAQVTTCLVILGQYADYARHGVWSGGWDLLVSAIEIPSIALIWLVFFPPERYRRWIASGSLPDAEAAS